MDSQGTEVDQLIDREGEKVKKWLSRWISSYWQAKKITK